MNVGDQFAGTLKLGTSSFALEGAEYESGLTHAMLMSETGNITTVGSGVQQIGGLGFNGGTLILVPLCRAIPLPATVLETSAAGTLDIRGKAQFRSPCQMR